MATETTASASSGETASPGALSGGLPASWYPQLLASVVDRVAVGRGRAFMAANLEVILMYWGIGRDILDRQLDEARAAQLIDRLSADLRRRFPDVRGYSPRNLKHMRSFAAAWPDLAIVQRTVAQLPWRHQVVLLEQLDQAELRLWYAAEAIAHGWTRDILAQQIAGQLHARVGRASTNFPASLSPGDSELAQQATRDPYVFDFVDQADPAPAHGLEPELVQRLEKFLLELGQGFAFVGQNVGLMRGGEEFYLDLLFYHLKLRSYVVVEVKAGDFDDSFLGRLGVRMAAVDDLLARPDDKPTIGLLLCRSKQAVVAEYALRASALPIGIAQWVTTLTHELPDELAAGLPSTDELEAELTGSAEAGSAGEVTDAAAAETRFDAGEVGVR